jgi:hypothetical protein
MLNLEGHYRIYKSQFSDPIVIELYRMRYVTSLFL